MPPTPTQWPVLSATPSQRDLDLSHPARLAESRSEGRWVSARHLELLSRTLMRQVYQPLRLMVAMPPRHGKSELASTWQPFWLLCRDPSKRILLASYGADFAARWGRRVRELVQDIGGEYGVHINPASRSVARWDTTAGGGMVCVGVGGSLTGRGADLLIIDDPVKSSAEATSRVYRDRLWDWYRSTARTRLEPGGSVILIMSRWHQADLAGMVLDDEYGETWDTLRLPALAETDDALGRSEGESAVAGAVRGGAAGGSAGRAGLVLLAGHVPAVAAAPRGRDVLQALVADSRRAAARRLAPGAVLGHGSDGVIGGGLHGGRTGGVP